ELMTSSGLSVTRALLSGEELLHQVGGLVRLDDQEEVPPAAHHVQTRLGKETGEYPRVDHGDDRVAVAGDHECRRLQPPDVWQARPPDGGQELPGVSAGRRRMTEPKFAYERLRVEHASVERRRDLLEMRP